MFSPSAIAAERASPDRVELLDERIDEGGIVGENAVLKVALAFGLRTHACTGEVRRSEIRLPPIYDDALEMDTRTKHPFHRRPKRWIAVEVIPPVRAWVFRMDEPHLDPALHHPVQDLQERHHIPPAGINVHILDICGRDPQPLPRLRYEIADDGLVDGTVREECGHLQVQNNPMSTARLAPQQCPCYWAKPNP